MEIRDFPVGFINEFGGCVALALPTQASCLIVSGVLMSFLARLLREPPTNRKIVKPLFYVKWHFYSSAKAVTTPSLRLHGAHWNGKSWLLSPHLFYKCNHKNLPGH